MWMGIGEMGWSVCDEYIKVLYAIWFTLVCT